MKTIVTILLALVLTVSFAWAGSYTITTTAEEDAAILAEATKRGQTADEYMTEYMRNAVVPHVKRLKADVRAKKWKDLQAACDGGDTASCTKVTEIKTRLGLP